MHRSPRASLRRLLASAVATTLVASAAVFGATVPAQAASYTLSATAAVDPATSVSVSVTGGGYGNITALPGQSQPSLYIALIPADTDLGSIQLGGSIPAAAVSPDSSGAISGSLEQSAATLDRTTSYDVIAWPSRSNPSASNLYARTGVVIDWAALFPATATATTLAAAPASAVAGTEVALTAAVAPAAAGSVEFFDGAASLGSAPVDAGTAVLRTSSLSVADHTLKAAFTPADTSAYEASTSTAITVSITAPPAERTPTLTLSKSTGLNPAGEEITVTGTGYNPNQPIYLTTCVDVPLSEVSFTFIASNRCTTGAKQITSNPTTPTMVKFQEDGSFTTTFTVQPKDGSTAVYTLANHTAMNDRSQDAKAVVSFAAVQPEPEPEPQPVTKPAVTVTPNTPLDPSVENVLTVSGTDFVGAGAANGAYVLFGESSVWSGEAPLPSAGWIAQAWVPSSAIVDGAFSVQLTVAAGVLDPSKSYQVATSAAHGLSITDRSLDTFTPVAVAVAEPVAPFVGFPVGASAQQGGVLTITGGGFQPGDAVTAVAHSEPVTIGTVPASGSGTVTFSWNVPADFPVGAHTVELSVNGAVVASAPFSVTAAAVVPAVEQVAAPVCVARAVSGASIDWGVKASFRSYITGSVANGSIEGGWGSGSGAFNTEADRGRVSFGGSVHYTGHSGALDMTLSNPRIQINSANSASLILNVQSKGFNGSPDTNASGIVFATLSLPQAQESANRVTFSGASATLTSAGAQAFAGFYEAGTALDSVTFSLPLGAEVPCDAATDNALASTGNAAPTGALWLGVGVIAFGGMLLVAVRRRQRA
ncbi:HtaA domain-containing protein [Microbacterium binotii]|uniref:Uncharacterized protein n=1 Tax=Microbacterium binotii TaxID=462710 RepID=A0ABP6BKQ9_9MICO